MTVSESLCHTIEVNGSRVWPHPVLSHETAESAVCRCRASLYRLQGPVAQRLEQGTHNPLVGGSNPSGPTKSPDPLERMRSRYTADSALSRRRHYLLCERRNVKLSQTLDGAPFFCRGAIRQGIDAVWFSFNLDMCEGLARVDQSARRAVRLDLRQSLPWVNELSPGFERIEGCRALCRSGIPN